MGGGREQAKNVPWGRPVKKFLPLYVRGKETQETQQHPVTHSIKLGTETKETQVSKKLPAKRAPKPASRSEIGRTI